MSDSKANQDLSGLPLNIDPYQELARTVPQTEFIKRVTTPMMLFARSEGWDPSLLRKRGRELSAVSTVVIKKSEHITPENGMAFISPVRRRPTSTTDGVVLGRSTSNDMVVPIASVSNVHCEFMAPKSPNDRWTIKDIGSSNGTFMNQTTLTPHTTYPLSDDQYIRLGKSVVAWFIAPAKLWEILRSDRTLSEHIDV